MKKPSITKVANQLREHGLRAKASKPSKVALEELTDLVAQLGSYREGGADARTVKLAATASTVATALIDLAKSLDRENWVWNHDLHGDLDDALDELLSAINRAFPVSRP